MNIISRGWLDSSSPATMIQYQMPFGGEIINKMYLTGAIINVISLSGEFK